MTSPSRSPLPFSRQQSNKSESEENAIHLRFTIYDLNASAPVARECEKRPTAGRPISQPAGLPRWVKTADGVRQFGQKRSFCPTGVRSREATPKQSS